MREFSLVCFLSRDLLLQFVRWAFLGLGGKPCFLVEIQGKRLTVEKYCFWLELAIIAPGQILRIGTADWRGVYDSTLLLGRTKWGDGRNE